ncbi:MAG: CapA family protein [Erysipelotrichaceae bacterium]
MTKTLLAFLLIFSLAGCASKETPPVEEPNEEPVVEETRVSLVGVGDNLIHETIYLDALQADGSYDFTKMYADVAPLIQAADLAFINQETIIGGKSLGLAGYPSFNTPTEMVQNLKDVGFDLFNLATNHTLDRSQSGINNTLAAFKQHPELVVDGAYDSDAAFQSIPVIEKEGIRFALLSYTYGTNGIQAPYAYSVSYFNEAQIRADVAKAKTMSDVIIVSAHWGDENQFTPSAFQQAYAQLFADLEVDVVLGTHPHVIQPLTWVEGANGNQTLVAYSLGNFIGGMLTTNNAISGMVGMEFVRADEDSKITIENVTWTPLITHFEGNQANILAERHRYQTFQARHYTDELAGKHVLNGYQGNVVSLAYIDQITRQVIDASFLK